ncbi:hypothetical protein CBL_11813 [Carabus blaptoides fortunei]
MQMSSVCLRGLGDSDLHGYRTGNWSLAVSMCLLTSVLLGTTRHYPVTLRESACIPITSIPYCPVGHTLKCLNSHFENKQTRSLLVTPPIITSLAIIRACPNVKLATGSNTARSTKPNVVVLQGEDSTLLCEHEPMFSLTALVLDVVHSFLCCTPEIGSTRFN